VTFAASSEFYKRHYTVLNKIDYWTDKGIMLNEIKINLIHKIFNFDGDLKVEEGSTPGSLAELTYRFSNVKLIYNRSFLKTPDILCYYIIKLINIIK